MSKKSRRQQREVVRQQSRRAWLIAGALALGSLAVLVWLLVADASPLRTTAQAGAASLVSYKPPDLHALVVSSTDERTVTFGHHQGMLISHDGGATWKPLVGAGGKDAMGVVLPANSRTAFAAGHDVFIRSDDGGQTWSSVRSGLPGTDIHGFASSATQPNTFYAFVVGSGLFKSTDGAASWAPLAQAPGSTMSLAATKSGTGDVLLASTMEGMARSRDGGRSWEPLRDVPAGALSAVGETVYVADRGTVMASADGGVTWQRRDFPRNAGLIAVAPSNTSVVYIVTDQREVWRSMDSGGAWERVG